MLESVETNSKKWTSTKIHRWCWICQYTSNDCSIGICSTWWSLSLFWTLLWLCQYFGRFRRNAPRRAPLFAQALWNMFHRTFNEIARTNNSIESWHRSFQATVRASHPPFWKFMEKLIQEQRLHRVNLLHVLGAHAAPPLQRQYFHANKRLLWILDNFPNLDAMQYLRSIAYNLGLH